MTLIRGAAKSALNQGLEQIDLELLSEAYDEYLAQAEKGVGENEQERVNPFYVDLTGQKTSKKKKPSRRAVKPRSSAGKAMGKRVRARKKESSLSEILSGQ
jgi:hypothetical protein